MEDVSCRRHRVLREARRAPAVQLE